MYLYACWRRKGEFGAGKEGRRRISLGGAVKGAEGEVVVQEEGGKDGSDRGWCWE